MDTLGMPVGKIIVVIRVPEDYEIEFGESNADINIADYTIAKKHGILKYDTSINELIYQDNYS